ncbi:hypothetical protein L7F22_054337 [Adiantum nelumboides]|nr:hypothetical protein [Adiantum nelumboides]
MIHGWVDHEEDMELPEIEIVAPHSISSRCPMKSYKFHPTKQYPTDDYNTLIGHKNLRTPWWDGSVIYGSNSTALAKVRTFKDGKLHIGDNGLLQTSTEDELPISRDILKLFTSNISSAADHADGRSFGDLDVQAFLEDNIDLSINTDTDTAPETSDEYTPFRSDGNAVDHQSTAAMCQEMEALLGLEHNDIDTEIDTAPETSDEYTSFRSADGNVVDHQSTAANIWQEFGPVVHNYVPSNV